MLLHINFYWSTIINVFQTQLQREGKKGGGEREGEKCSNIRREREKGGKGKGKRETVRERERENGDEREREEKGKRQTDTCERKAERENGA